MDSTAIHALHELIDELKSSGVTFIIANVIGPVRDKLASSGITDQIGKEKCFSSLFDAYQFAKDHLVESDGK